MASLWFTLVSAEQEIYKGPASFVGLPGVAGDLGILPGHQAMLTRIRPGAIKLASPPADDAYFYVTGGFAEIQAGTVLVLADTALRARSLDEAKAARARAENLESQQQRHQSIDFARAHQELVLTAARVTALRKRGSGGSFSR